MKGNSFLALLAGAAAGFIGALFVSDETREKVRKATADGYNDFKDGASDAVHEAQVRARYARREMNSIKETLKEQGSTMAADVKEKLLSKLEKLEKALSNDEILDDEVDDQTPENNSTEEA